MDYGQENGHLGVAGAVQIYEEIVMLNICGSDEKKALSKEGKPKVLGKITFSKKFRD